MKRIKNELSQAEIEKRKETWENMEYKGGLKLDTGKPMMGLVPSAALMEVAKVMTFGAEKYTPNNWRGGFDYSRLYDAGLRHIHQYIDGEDKDPESKLSHIAHAACCMLMLLEHELKGYGDDDRYKDE